MLADVIRRSLWLGVGAAAGRLLPLMVLLVAGRHMDARQFASASAAYAWAGVAMSLTSAGVSTVLTQRLAGVSMPEQQRLLLGHHLRLSLWLSCALAASVLVGGSWGSVKFFGAALDSVVILPAALSGALWSQVTLSVAALNGCHRASNASALLALCGLLQGASMATALLVAGHDAHALSWGILVGNALGCVVAIAWLARAFQIHHWFQLLSARFVAPTQVAIFSNPVLWLSVASGLVLPVTFFASGMIARSADGQRQLAQYFALEQLHQALVYVPAIIGQALLPIISRNLAQTESAALRAQVLKRVAALALIAAAVGVGLGVMLTIRIDWLIKLLGNPAISVEDAWAMRLMVMNAALGVSLSITGGAILGSGKIFVAGACNLSWSVAFIGLTALFAAHGNLGLQMARFIASTALAIAAAAILFQTSRSQLQAKRVTPVAAP